MMENITKQINSLISTLITSYRRQGQVVRILIPALLVLAFCCLCSVLIPLLSRNPSNALPSPNVFPTDGTAGPQATPTSLFNFDFPTFTPFPTLTSFVPSAFPTLTASPTGTQTPTRLVPTATVTAIPSGTASPLPTATNPPPTATATSVRSVEIITVNKPAEYVEIQNFSPAPVDLLGWRLVSETGNQSCNLRGTLAPSEVLRIWTHRGNPGFDCRLPNDIWRDNVADPAVLYNPQGQEVSRFP
jgi:lamin tail-like protein